VFKPYRKIGFLSSVLEVRLANLEQEVLAKRESQNKKKRKNHKSPVLRAFQDNCAVRTFFSQLRFIYF
jgi:hypothetical protein